MKKLFAMLAGALMFLTGCSSSARVEDHANMKPELDIRKYFDGEVKAEGIFIDRYGKSENFFHVHDERKI